MKISLTCLSVLGARTCVELEEAKTREREVRALEEAMEELFLKEGTIVTLHSEETIASRAGNIRVVPAWKWALHGFGAES
ncbi:MAG: hypothetical protein SFV15_05150 [Polyangiaceae bacterium]|nr:hypothetical protein [Polyangiaceae bacterium]